MAKSKSKKAAVVPAPDRQWSSWRRKVRNGGRCALWLAGPLLSMAALARMGAPDLEQTPSIIPAGEPQHCAYWAREGHCEPTSEYTSYMREKCGRVCAETPRGAAAPIASAEPSPDDSWANPAECKAWAGSGECEKNPDFMNTHCAGSCAALGRMRRLYRQRCPRPGVYEQALPAGKMASTFARILSEFAHLEPEEISSDPPVILFHKFLSDDEAEAFIAHGKGRYEKSLGVGMKADGTMAEVQTDIRTSSHGWCQHAACLNDPRVQNVVARVSDITQTPSTNAEFAQLVYYHACDEADPTQKCAFYRRHSDYIEGEAHKLQGVRIYTLFAYLNDVPEGGGTRFTDLPGGPVTFQPQRGKAILWPSVLGHSPHEKDDRTHHEALPVLAGEKFGANFWIHQYDFKGAHAADCIS